MDHKIFLFFILVINHVNLGSTTATTECPSKLATKKSVNAALDYNRTINVRTVLFTKADACKVCWSPEEANLLIARRLMQDLIPKRIPKDFNALLEYINTCVTVVKTKTTGKVSQTMLRALYDALGGYLHSVVIPILNEAFYAGNVDYSTTSQLHYLLGMMMAYLGTNGARWAYPCDMSKIPTKVSSLPLRMCSGEDACQYFVMLDKTTSLAGANNVSTPLCSSSVKIQIPFLDDNSYPSAIAIPLKDHALLSLMSECSVNIIPKYYVMAMRCLASAQYTRRDIVNFNHQLHQWIISTVVPHLHELDRWYPGFGGVMRVVETMNRRGLASSEPIKPNIRPPDVNFSACFGKETCGSTSFFGGGGGGHGVGGIHLSEGLPWILLILAIIFGCGAIVLTCSIFRCLFAKFRKKKLFSSEEDDVNAMVSLYCGLREGSHTEGKVNTKTSGSKTFGTSSYTGSSSGGT